MIYGYGEYQQITRILSYSVLRLNLLGVISLRKNMLVVENLIVLF